MGEGVAERFGAGGVQETRGGFTSGVAGVGRDLFLDLFFLPPRQVVVLLALTSIEGERTVGGDGAGLQDN